MRNHYLALTLTMFMMLLLSANAWAQIPPPLSDVEIAEAIEIALSCNYQVELYQRLDIFCRLSYGDTHSIVIQGPFQRTAAYVLDAYLKAKEARIPFKLDLDELAKMSQNLITVTAIAPKPIYDDEPSPLKYVDSLAIQRIEPDGRVGPFIEPVYSYILPNEREESEGSPRLGSGINTLFHPWLFPRDCDIKITVGHLDGSAPLTYIVEREYLEKMR